MKPFYSLLVVLVTVSSVHLVFMSPISQGGGTYPTTSGQNRILSDDFQNFSSSIQTNSPGSSSSIQLDNIKRTRKEAFKLSNSDWRRLRLLSEETLSCDEANRFQNEARANTVTLPPDVCGLCPSSGPEGGLYPCTCVNNGGSMGGTISIDCPPEVSSQEILRDIIQRTDFLTTNVSRFSLTQSNITGVLDLKMLGPLTVRVLILDNDLFQDVDNRAFNSSEHTLTTISLANNLIAYFHFDSVAAIPLLKSMDLSGNLLEFIPTQAFMHPLMQILNLSRNNIYTLSYEAFLGMSSVEIIDISDNNLSELQQNTFKITSHDVNKVLEIDLSNNFLRYMSPDAFADLNNLQVNLSNNELTTLDNDVFQAPIQNSGYFAQFIVEGNPIRCDCGIYWIIENSLFTNCFDNFHCQDINATLYQLNPDDYVACSSSSTPAGENLVGKGPSRLASSSSSTPAGENLVGKGPSRLASSSSSRPAGENLVGKGPSRLASSSSNSPAGENLIGKGPSRLAGSFSSSPAGENLIGKGPSPLASSSSSSPAGENLIGKGPSRLAGSSSSSPAGESLIGKGPSRLAGSSSSSPAGENLIGKGPSRLAGSNGSAISFVDKGQQSSAINRPESSSVSQLEAVLVKASLVEVALVETSISDASLVKGASKVRDHW